MPVGDAPLIPHEPHPEESLGRGRRAKRATQKVIDIHPEGPRPIVTSDSGGEPPRDVPNSTADDPVDDDSSNRVQHPI